MLWSSSPTGSDADSDEAVEDVNFRGQARSLPTLPWVGSPQLETVLESDEEDSVHELLGKHHF